MEKIGGRERRVLAEARRVSRRRFTHFEVILATPHVTYLAYLAQRDDVSISRAFRSLIQNYIAPEAIPEQSASKTSLHLSIEPEPLANFNRLAHRLGLPRSEVARQLIDKAMAEDPILRLVG